MGTGRKNCENGQILGQAMGGGKKKKKTFLVLQNNIFFHLHHAYQNTMSYFENQRSALCLIIISNQWQCPTKCSAVVSWFKI